MVVITEEHSVLPAFRSDGVEVVAVGLEAGEGLWNFEARADNVLATGCLVCRYRLIPPLHRLGEVTGGKFLIAKVVTYVCGKGFESGCLKVGLVLLRIDSIEFPV